ncbi:TonB-dependent receptor [Stutzerimonas kirkiae]|uniref:TonB-dependent receptor n=1 Tax=Stutzerimonas kirkiae TaxID=2211392 RepID=UPI0010385787|nr:TonB-dependent receptor [Stutzerimonas kirkiae]TBV04332.1 TonB-dependent receptor [Stutzerimonas kirkiae]
MKLSRLALLASVLPLAAHAAGNDPLELSPTIITRATELKNPAPASVAVITRQQIDASASNDLLDLLRGQAGLQIRDSMGDGNRAMPSLRGFGENSTNNTLVLVDGRRLNQPTLAGPDLNSVPLANIERIEIIRGAGTVLYGDQAVGGVINIITRTPRQNEAYLEASRGSHDLEAYRGHVNQQLGAGFSLYASGETRNSDNYRDHNDGNYSSAFARLRHDHANGHLLYEYQTVDDELLYPNALSRAQRHIDRQFSDSQAWFDSKIQVHRFALEQRLNDTWSLNFDYSDSDQDGVGSWGPGSEFSQDTRIETFSPRLTGRFDNRLGRAEWLLGHDHITSDYENRAAWSDTLSRQTLRDWYTQFSQTFHDDLTLTLGYRASEVDDDNHGLDLEHRDREGSTSIGLSWQIERNLRAFIKREDVLRWANVDENAFTAPDVVFLKPQTGDSWETGIEWKDARQRYQATLYRLALDNELMYDPFATGPYSPWSDGANINLDKTLRKGLLLEGERQLSGALSIGGQYSFTDAEYRAGSFQGKQVPWVSRHSASAHLAYQILPGLRGYLETLYTGKRYYSGDDSNEQGQAGSYTLFNAALRYDYRQFDARLRLNNLTGKRYDGFASKTSRYPAAEENIQLSVGYRF